MEVVKEEFLDVGKYAVAFAVFLFGITLTYDVEGCSMFVTTDVGSGKSI
jgi:hypothetical protein